MKAFRGFALTGLVAVAVTAFSFVSPAKIGDVQLGRANLWSGLLEWDDAEMSDEFSPDFESLCSKVGTPAGELPVETSFYWDADSSSHGDADSLSLRDIDSLSLGKTYRIAFLGDSFIEGDILVGDLRENLQAEFGGGGPGFIPCELPFGIYRHTAKVRGTGWKKYGIMKYKGVPENLRDDFLFSGYMAFGGKGAEMTWERGQGFGHIDSSDVCRVFFLNRSDCSLELRIDGGRNRTFSVKGASALRQIVVGADTQTLSLKVLSGNLICYGASFESSRGGVQVDNFSVRSNNGGAMFRSNAAFNRRMAEMAGYDAVVLQYGLNIMLPDKSNYAKYQKQLEDMIQFAKISFPESRIVVMGVTDRGFKREGDTTFTSINSAPALTGHQKAAADSQGALFWDTCGEMERLGGLETFVDRGWIASDWVHFTFYGGRVLAREMTGFWREMIEEKVRENRKDTVLESVEADSSLFGIAIPEKADGHVSESGGIHGPESGESPVAEAAAQASGEIPVTEAAAQTSEK